MKQFLTIAVLAISGIASADLSASASSTATIAHTGSPSSIYFDAANSSFGTFGIADFTFTKTANFVATALNLNLTQSDNISSTVTSVDFFISSNTAAAYSSLHYTNGGSHDGIDSALTGAPASLYLLGTATFTPGKTGDLDHFSFSSTGALAAYIDTQVANGSDIRLIIGAETPVSGAAVDATWAGKSNPTYAGPSATLVGSVQAVPEPMSVTLLGLGIVGLIKRKNAR